MKEFNTGCNTTAAISYNIEAVTDFIPGIIQIYYTIFRVLYKSVEYHI